MFWIGMDIMFFGLIAIIFIFRKNVAKSISMLIAIIYCAFMCECAVVDENIIFLIIYILIGILCTMLLYLTERKNIKKPSKYKKSKIAAAILSFFLGGFGIHKFYLGQKVLGAIYLLFWWTMIPLYIGFIEALVFFIMQKKDFDKKFNEQQNVKNTSFEGNLQQFSIKKIKSIFRIKSKIKRTSDESADFNTDNDSSKEKNENKDIKINLPIGSCNINGNDLHTEIEIISNNGKHYRFFAQGDCITDFWKSGMSEKKSYEV